MRLALLLFLLSGNAWATNFYVCPDTQGEYGAEDGTSLGTCYDGNAGINWGAIAAGDTLYLCGDWLPADARFTISDSGSAGNYITLSGLASACNRSSNSTISRLGLTGAGARAISAANTAATRQYIRIEDLTIKNTSTAILWDYSTTGAVADDTSLWVRRVTFQSCGTAAGTDGDCIWKRGEGLIVTDSSFDGCYEDCIWTRGKNITVSSNTFTNISFGDALGDATQMDLTGVTDSGYSRWFNNTCDHQAADNKYCFVVGPTAGAGSSVDVYGNTALCPRTPTNGGASNQCHPIYLDVATATAVTIMRNFTQGGEVGISLTAAAAASFSTRAQIVGNVVYGPSDRGIWADGNVDNIDIWNNTVSNAGQTGLYIGKAGASMNANNNILANSGVGMFYITAPTSRGYNNYFGNTTNVSANGVADTTTTGDITTDPKFRSNPNLARHFKPQAGSGARRAGTELNIGNVQDNGNRAFSHPPTIGAWEATSGDDAGTRTAATRTAATTRAAATTRTAR